MSSKGLPKNLVILTLFFLLASSFFAGIAHAKPVVVIDPGHGGKDPGAIGHKKAREKDIVLSLSKKLANELQPHAKASLTRTNDRYLTLDQRDDIANRHKCDMFVSIHTNAAKRRSARGFEIYYLNNATDEASRRLAERENIGAKKDMGDLEAILSNLIQTASTAEASEAAVFLKNSVLKKMRRYNLDARIKTALFYVLVGAKCPSLLIETGFVSNQAEAKRLKENWYQNELARAIADGIRRYFLNRDSSRGNL